MAWCQESFARGVAIGYHPAPLGVTFFDESLFVYFLLPPIIFEAGFSLIKRPFFRNLGTILLFAVPGTVLTMLVIGGSLYAAAESFPSQTVTRAEYQEHGHSLCRRRFLA